MAATSFRYNSILLTDSLKFSNNKKIIPTKLSRKLLDKSSCMVILNSICNNGEVMIKATFGIHFCSMEAQW